MSLLEDLKSVVGTIQKIDNIELYRQILDLQNEVLQVVTENTELKSRVAKLIEEADLQRSLRFEFNTYWSGETLETSDGPFCSKCWDADHKLVRLHLVTPNPNYSRCPVCDKSLRVPRRENGFDRSQDNSPSIVIGGPSMATEYDEVFAPLGPRRGF